MPQPAPMADIEMSNCWTATHPESPFVSGLLVSRQWPDGRRLVLSDFAGEPSLQERTAEETRATPVAAADIPALLGERFDLDGFALDPDGSLARAPRARGDGSV